jgi:hypothetical protein
VSTVLGVAQAAVEASEMDAVSTVLVVVRAVIEQLETMEESEQLARQLVTQLRILLKVSSKLNNENCSTLEAAMDRVRQVLDALPPARSRATHGEQLHRASNRHKLKCKKSCTHLPIARPSWSDSTRTKDAPAGASVSHPSLLRGTLPAADCGGLDDDDRRAGQQDGAKRSAAVPRSWAW